MSTEDRRLAEKLLKNAKKNKEANKNKRSSIDLAASMLPLIMGAATSQRNAGESQSAHKRRQALGAADVGRQVTAMRQGPGYDDSDDSDESDDSRRYRHRRAHDAKMLAQQQQFQSSQMEQQQAFMLQMFGTKSQSSAAGMTSGGGGGQARGASAAAGRLSEPTASDDLLAETGDKIQAELDRRVDEAVRAKVTSLEQQLAAATAAPAMQPGAYGGLAYAGPPWNQQVLQPGGAHAFGMGPGPGFGRGGSGPPGSHGEQSGPPWQAPWGGPYGGPGGYGDPGMHARRDASHGRQLGHGARPFDPRGASQGSPGFQSPPGNWHASGRSDAQFASVGRGRGGPRDSPGSGGRERPERQQTSSRGTGFSPRMHEQPRSKKARKVNPGPAAAGVRRTVSPPKGNKARVAAPKVRAVAPRGTAAETWHVAVDHENGINDDFSFEYDSLPVTMTDDGEQVSTHLPVFQVAKIFSEYERVFEEVLPMTFSRVNMASDGTLISDALIALERHKARTQVEAETLLATKLSLGLARGASEGKDRQDREEVERQAQAEEDAEREGLGKDTPGAAAGAAVRPRYGGSAAAGGLKWYEGAHGASKPQERARPAPRKRLAAAPSGEGDDLAPAGRGRGGARGGRGSRGGKGRGGARGTKRSKAKKQAAKPVVPPAEVAVVAEGAEADAETAEGAELSG